MAWMRFTGSTISSIKRGCYASHEDWITANQTNSFTLGAHGSFTDSNPEDGGGNGAVKIENSYVLIFGLMMAIQLF